VDGHKNTLTYPNDNSINDQTVAIGAASEGDGTGDGAGDGASGTDGKYAGSSG